MGAMSQSLFNLKSSSCSLSNIVVMRGYILIKKASQRAYAIGSSREKPSWTADGETGCYRPETKTKELDSHVVTTSKTEVKMRRGDELWWMPDTQTGFYRPDTCVRELDAVELRSMHSKHRE
ncbi:Late embryogenesis abundant protein 37 [Hirschfeldia incana]|nr:Late embryogenesis abundant protein 37 [Hirschfeldia incana]